VIDVFLFCDLDVLRLSARGTVRGDEILPLLRALGQVPAGAVVEVDVSELETDAVADALLSAAMQTRTAA
jgi:hypothetical protein